MELQLRLANAERMNKELIKALEHLVDAASMSVIERIPFTEKSPDLVAAKAVLSKVKQDPVVLLRGKIGRAAEEMLAQSLITFVRDRVANLANRKTVWWPTTGDPVKNSK